MLIFLRYYFIIVFFQNSVSKNNVKVGWDRLKVGIKGCRKLHLPVWTYLGVATPLFRAILPYPFNILFNNLMVKFNPRSK